jgi:hypothetical protein
MPDDGLNDYSGTRLQSRLLRSWDVRGNPRPGGARGLRSGLVLRVHHKDEDTNTNGNYAEYDVLLIESMLTIRNLPVFGQRLARDSGDEVILKAATDTPDIDDPTQAMQNIHDSDGDLVIVAWIDRIFPGIIGTLNHFVSGEDTAPWHGESADGERRAIHHKDVHAVIKPDGDVEVDLPVDKSITIAIDGTQVFTVVRTGGATTLELGTGGHALILGDTFRTWFNTNIDGHDHTLPAATGSDPGGGPHTHSIGGSTGALSATMPANHLSDVSETE